MTVTPFTIAIDENRLARTLDRVRDYEWFEAPAAATGANAWAYGTNKDYLQELCSYWLNEYDWRAVEAELNALPHFTAPVEVDGDVLELHFIHEKGSQSRARPLIITHGWPGSFVEFLAVIDPLAHPERHGGKAEDGFDVIVPSLPGYGFSGKPQSPIGPRKTAAYFNKLMVDVLGYSSYFAQGGDWGCMVTSWLGKDHAAACKGIHINMQGFRSMSELSTKEDQDWANYQRMVFELEGAYFRLQATKGQTLAYGMMDSPVGQAAWILEKFHRWAQTDGDNVESAFSKKHLLTNIMIYILTRTFHTATWMYRGMAEEAGTYGDARVETPTGIGNFPGDILARWPRREIVERSYNVVHWTDHPKGGHFAAMEQPELFVDDVRACFGTMAL